MKKADTESFAPFLRMTRQRRMILEEVNEPGVHPTAEDVYRAVRKKLPHISLGTVYRNLELLAECGMVQKLDIGGHASRFDGGQEDHAHAFCVVCGRIEDVRLPPRLDIAAECGKASGYDIRSHRVEFTGVCPECRRKKKS